MWTKYEKKRKLRCFCLIPQFEINVSVARTGEFHEFCCNSLRTTKTGPHWPIKQIHPVKKKSRLIFNLKALVFLHKLQSHTPHRNSIPTCTRQDYQHNLLLQLIKTLLLHNWPDVAHFNQIKLPKDQPVLLTVASDQAVCPWPRRNVLNLTWAEEEESPSSSAESSVRCLTWRV